MSMPRESEFIHAPAEVTAERFDEMLNILPPMKWRGGRGQQSFMMCEFTYGCITTIFCEIGGRYFEMQDYATLTHAEIATQCAMVRDKIDAAKVS